VPEILDLMRQHGMADVPVVVGGIIPDDDVAYLKQLGVAAVFGPGTPLHEIAEAIRQLAGGQ
jgi:methylmalonyl-CoA mutase C-terminal domain/subunit